MVSEETPPLFFFLFIPWFSLRLARTPELSDLVVKHAQVCGSEGGKTMHAAFSEDERRDRASQEATWARASSPVSRLLNPVSNSTKQEEAQPPHCGYLQFPLQRHALKNQPVNDKYPALWRCSLTLGGTQFSETKSPFLQSSNPFTAQN